MAKEKYLGQQLLDVKFRNLKVLLEQIYHTRATVSVYTQKKILMPEDRRRVSCLWKHEKTWQLTKEIKKNLEKWAGQAGLHKIFFFLAPCLWKKNSFLLQ